MYIYKLITAGKQDLVIVTNFEMPKWMVEKWNSEGYYIYDLTKN